MKKSSARRFLANIKSLHLLPETVFNLGSSKATQTQDSTETVAHLRRGEKAMIWPDDFWRWGQTIGWNPPEAIVRGKKRKLLRIWNLRKYTWGCLTSNGIFIWPREMPTLLWRESQQVHDFFAESSVSFPGVRVGPSGTVAITSTAGWSCRCVLPTSEKKS